MAWRIAAWYATGPVGHLVAGAADWFELFRGYAGVEVRRRINR